MSKGLVAQASISIHAVPDVIWKALMTPEIMKQFFFGADVISAWKVGSPICYRGTWEGKFFEDKGTVLDLRPPHFLAVTHWSPLSGVADRAENYHTVTFELAAEGDGTRLTIVQDNNASADEVEHSARNWRRLLETLKSLVEELPAPGP